MFLSAWRGVRDFSRSEPSWHEIVFCAESESDWIYFEGLIEELLRKADCRISYLTSSRHDPVFTKVSSRLRGFYIGGGVARTWLFFTLKAKVMVMTMPDLETFHLKRSRFYPVHYVYLFHTLASSHAKYRMGALDHFDTIFCAGEHHVAEIEAMERTYQLPKKRLVRFGYGKLDKIRKLAASNRRELKASEKWTVLIAPTWGPFSLLEACGTHWMDILLGEGFHVILRPHPITQRQNATTLVEIIKRFGSRANFEVDETAHSLTSMARADVMISECSGAAFEFAFGFERPVLFMDLPMKVRNLSYHELKCDLLEEKIRMEIGALIPVSELNDMGGHIQALMENAHSMKEQIRNARSKWVFHPGQSSAIGAQEILHLVKRP